MRGAQRSLRHHAPHSGVLRAGPSVVTPQSPARVLTSSCWGPSLVSLQAQGVPCVVRQVPVGPEFRL